MLRKDGAVLGRQEPPELLRVCKIDNYSVVSRGFNIAYVAPENPPEWVIITQCVFDAELDVSGCYICAVAPDPVIQLELITCSLVVDFQDLANLGIGSPFASVVTSEVAMNMPGMLNPWRVNAH